MKSLDILSPASGEYSNQDEVYLQQLFQLYHLQLMTHERLLSKLSAYGIASPRLEVATVGWCDRALGQLVASSCQAQADCCRGALRRIGLLRQSGHQLFLGCIVIPQFGRNGQIVGALGCRVAPRIPKGKPVCISWKRGPEVTLSSKLMERICHAFHP